MKPGNHMKWLGTAVLCLAIFLFNNCEPVGEPSSSDGSSLGSDNNNDTGNGGNNNNNNNPPPGTNAGQTFFQNNVRTSFQTNCNSCHAEPRFITPPNIAAPLSIFEYNLARAMLVNGRSSTDNQLINKMRGIVGHFGGDRCAATGLTSGPCKVVIDWWNQEFPSSPSGIAGTITFISELGRVTGWAMDPSDAAKIVRVYFYGDSPVGTGTSLGNVLADQMGNGPQNGHYFVFDLPAAFRNNVPHMLYAYGDMADANHLFQGTPKAYAAYTQRPAGLAYFNNQVAPRLGQCAGCHAADYNTFWNFQFATRFAKRCTVGH